MPLRKGDAEKHKLHRINYFLLPTMSLVQIKLSSIKLDMKPSTPYICIHINVKSSLCSCTRIDMASVRSLRYQRTKANMSQEGGIFFFFNCSLSKELAPPKLDV